MRTEDLLKTPKAFNPAWKKYFTPHPNMLDFNEKDDGIKVLLNEVKLEFDVQPVICENTILIPVRVALENLCAIVLWDGDKCVVISELGENVSEIPIGGTEFFVNGKSYTADIPAQLLDGRTLVPVDVLEIVGECKIDCDIENSIVTIIK